MTVFDVGREGRSREVQELFCRVGLTCLNTGDTVLAFGMLIRRFDGIVLLPNHPDLRNLFSKGKFTRRRGPILAF